MTLESLFSSLLIADTGSLGLMDVVLGSLVPVAFAIPVSLLYRWTQKKSNYTPIFAQALLLFALLTSVVTLIIGGNIARAFGLVGALSIVRFRTALKSPIETVYVFWVLVIGMACGSGYYLAAATFVAISCAVAIVMHKLNYGEVSEKKGILRVEVTAERAAPLKEEIEAILKREVSGFECLNVVHQSDQPTRLFAYIVYGRDQGKLNEVFNKVESLEGIVKTYRVDSAKPTLAA